MILTIKKMNHSRVQDQLSEACKLRNQFIRGSQQSLMNQSSHRSETP